MSADFGGKIGRWFRLGGCTDNALCAGCLIRSFTGSPTSDLVSWTTAQDKAPISIATIDISALINFHKDARMAKRCGPIPLTVADFARAIATYTALFDKGDFAVKAAHHAF